MSLFTVWVQSQSGQWYEYPTIRQEDWFICWDDDDPIELVVKKEMDESKVIFHLREQGWKVWIDHENECCGQRMFGGKDIFEEARSFFLGQENGPPDSLLPGDFRVKFNPFEEELPGIYYLNKPVYAEHHDMKDELGYY